MIHHEGNVLLGKRTEVVAFGEEITNEFMVPFCGAFLIRGTGITVEDPGSEGTVLVGFNSGRVGKLSAVVRETEGEDLSEIVAAKFQIQRFKDVDDGL